MTQIKSPYWIPVEKGAIIGFISDAGYAVAIILLEDGTFDECHLEGLKVIREQYPNLGPIGGCSDGDR